MSEFKVKFNRNVKLGNELYSKGDTATVESDVFDELRTAGVTDDDFEQIAEKPKVIEDMTIAELKEYAAEKEIDLGESTKKDDILAIIQGNAGGGDE